MYIYILTHFLTSQPALIKLDNKNIGGHLTPLQYHIWQYGYVTRHDLLSVLLLHHMSSPLESDPWCFLPIHFVHV